jgi:glycine dehydrogenase
VANASLLDEGTAAAEAMAVAERVSKAKTRKFFVDEHCHPQTIAVLRTRAEPLGWQVVIGNPDTDLEASDVFGAIFQYPGTDGEVRDFRPAIARLKAAGALSIMAATPEQKKNNARLGLILASVAVVFFVGFLVKMILLTSR